MNNIKLLQNYIVSNCQEKDIFKIIEKYYKELCYSTTFFQIKKDCLNYKLSEKDNMANLAMYIAKYHEKYDIDETFIDMYYDTLKQYIRYEFELFGIFLLMDIEYSTYFIKKHIKDIEKIYLSISYTIRHSDDATKKYFRGLRNKLIEKYDKYISPEIIMVSGFMS